VILSRKQILGAKDRVTEQVSVPEWGGEVLVATISGAARDRFEASIIGDGQRDISNVRAKLAAACMVDEKGELLFTAEDVEALGQKSAAALERVVQVAQRLNRIGERDLEDLKGN